MPGYTHFITDQRRLSAPFQIPKRHIRSPSPQLRTSATHSSTISTLSNSETPHPKPLTPAAYLRFPFFHYQHPFKFRNATSEAPRPSCVPPLPILPLSAPFQIPKHHIRSSSPQLRTSATHSSTIIFNVTYRCTTFKFSGRLSYYILIYISSLWYSLVGYPLRPIRLHADQIQTPTIKMNLYQTTRTRRLVLLVLNMGKMTWWDLWLISTIYNLRMHKSDARRNISNSRPINIIQYEFLWSHCDTNKIKFAR